jgi:hypothetical protein
VVGEAALLVDPTRPEAITAAMGDLIRERATANRLTVAGLLQASGFRWNDTARKVEGLLHELA